MDNQSPPGSFRQRLITLLRSLKKPNEPKKPTENPLPPNAAYNFYLERGYYVAGVKDPVRFMLEGGLNNIRAHEYCQK